MTEACDALTRYAGQQVEVGFRLANSWMLAMNDLYVGLIDVAKAEDDDMALSNEAFFTVTSPVDVQKLRTWRFTSDVEQRLAPPECFTFDPPGVLAGATTTVRMTAKVPASMVVDGKTIIMPNSPYWGAIVDADVVEGVVELPMTKDPDPMPAVVASQGIEVRTGPLKPS